MSLSAISQSVVLGIVEGLTEFLPVSSTAHLVLSKQLIAFKAIDDNLFEIFIQIGAILAICLTYRGKLGEVVCGLGDKKQQRFAGNVLLAFLPAVVLGVMFHKVIKEVLFSNVVIAASLITGGVVMILVDRRPVVATVEQANGELADMRPRTALVIGLIQCLAMVPGVSRSGATIIGGMLLGLQRRTATEFSFFLAIPTIAGASLYELAKHLDRLNADSLGLLLLGTLSAFLSALLVIRWFIQHVSRHNFVPFGIYRIILGLLILGVVGT